MRKSRFTEEQIITTLKELEAGTPAKELSRRHGVSQQTLYRWKSKYGGMEVSEARLNSGPAPRAFTREQLERELAIVEEH